MKCHRQPTILKNRPTPITEVWEVRIGATLWLRTKLAAKKRRCSYSSITRYCIFRFAEQAFLRPRKFTQKMRRLTADEFRRSNSVHRHMACFYGEDIKLVKLVAMQLEMTVTALIRIALHLYLPRLAMDFHSKKHVSRDQFHALCHKRWIAIPMAALNFEGAPMIRRLAFASFPPWLRW